MQLHAPTSKCVIKTNPGDVQDGSDRGLERIQRVPDSRDLFCESTPPGARRIGRFKRDPLPSLISHDEMIVKVGLSRRFEENDILQLVDCRFRGADRESSGKWVKPIPSSAAIVVIFGARLIDFASRSIPILTGQR